MSIYDHPSALAARAIYDRWFCSEDTDFLSDYISQLDEILVDGDPSGEVNYVYGQFVYHQQCEIDGDTDLALDYFLTAVSQNSSHYMAHLYAGHCHHDKARYVEAIREYRLVDTEKLMKEYPIWRVVKLLEQQGECLYHIGERDAAINTFNQVLDCYKVTPPDELVDPQEVYRALDSTHPIVVALRGLTAFKDDNLG